jgi:putative transcriptional regulator
MAALLAGYYKAQMSGFVSFANHFLIAMPSLADPNFFRTVTLICEHNNAGAMGIVINRMTDLSLQDILQQIGVKSGHSDEAKMSVYFGGPVQTNRGFVVHEPLGNWESTLAVTDTLGVSTSRDVLAALAEKRGPDRCLVALGYAGWSAGQLEQEIAENSWLSGPADHSIVFKTPVEERWRAAAELLGVDLSTISTESGHA